jgi:hypothetical protein
MRRAVHLLGGLSFVLLLGGCVPHTEISGAPCDCPDGYICCETLMACVKVDAECPSEYPNSSKIPCTANSLCSRTEACWIWTEGGDLQGPSECRRRCPKEYPCSQGEVCDLVPTNASPLEDPELLKVCIPE